MTDAGWAGDQQAEELADKMAVKAVDNVLGAHKLTCDEHENLQQDFKDVAPEAYQQGRVAGLMEAADFVEVQELADPSGLSRKEQLRIYDILIKVEAGIRNLAIEHQAQGEQP